MAVRSWWRFRAGPVLAVASALALHGCRTVNDTLVDYRANISSGQYGAAAKEPEELAAKGGAKKRSPAMFPATATQKKSREADHLRSSACIPAITDNIKPNP